MSDGKKISKHKKFNQKGFTLLDVLTAISIITLLASQLLVSFKNAHDSGNNVKVQADLVQMESAMELMTGDTGLWPNGCKAGFTLNPVEGTNNEISLTAATGGLLTKPPVGVTDSSANCNWTQAAVGSWKGPYTVSRLVDPWGSPYWFDNDYHPGRDCPNQNSNPGAPTVSAIVSLGPSKAGVAYPDHYGCGQIYLILPAPMD